MFLAEPITLNALADYLDGTLIGEGEDFVVTGLAALDRAGPGDISFLTNPKYRYMLSQTQAGAVLVSDDEDISARCRLIRVQNAYLALARVLTLFYPPVLPQAGIHPSAVIAPDAVIGKEVRLDAHVRIEQGVRIGENTVVFAGVYIGRNTRIGSNCIIYPGVSIYHGITIGDRVIIHAGAVIGSDGFGYAKDRDRYVKIPQIGGVEVHDDVEIGANCSIDRGSMGVTVIGSGTKLDNLVHLAHNVTIGENSVIAAQGGVAGSTSIGSRAIFGGQVGISGHMKVGDDVTLTARATIMKNVPSRTVISGFPQMPHREWKRNQVALRHVPELLSAVKRLQQKVIELENRLGMEERKEPASDCEDSDN